MNVNLFKNGKYISCSYKNDVTGSCHLFKKYNEFLSSFGLKQLITSPTRITCNTTSLIDHILTNTENKISQSGVIDTGLSDHQLIFCTRKLNKIKTGSTKYLSFRSMKKYTKELFIKNLDVVNFPNYENFQDTNLANSDFLNKLTKVINDIAPTKQSKVKNRSQEWFDGQIAEKISIRDKLFKKLKKSRLHVDEIVFKQARNDVENIIKRKKKIFFENKLNENIGKPKQLWKALNHIGLPKKSSSGAQNNICIKDNDKLMFDPSSIAKVFNFFFSDIAKNLLDRLPTAPNRFNKNSVSTYYSSLNLEKKFNFSRVTVETVQDILKNFDVTKSAGIDNISGLFLKDGAEVLSSPIAQLCNLSILTSSFPDACKTAKLLPLYKKGCKTDSQNYRPISLLPLVSKIIEK